MTHPYTQILLMTAMPLLMAGCDLIDQKTTYKCDMSGESFRYQGSSRQEPQGKTLVNFDLSLFKWRSHYAISANPLIPEQDDQRVVLDKSRSTSAEVVYLYDKLNPETKERVVTSLVLNTVSGDARLFHRKWVTPSEWKNSAQYSYTGNCKPQATYE